MKKGWRMFFWGFTAGATFINILVEIFLLGNK